MPAVHSSRIAPIYHVHRYVSAPNTTENIPEGAAPVHPASSNVTRINLKGASASKAAEPYQGAVVFAVLVGQVCNGG